MKNIFIYCLKSEEPAPKFYKEKLWKNFLEMVFENQIRFGSQLRVRKVLAPYNVHLKMITI